MTGAAATERSRPPLDDARPRGSRQALRQRASGRPRRPDPARRRGARPRRRERSGQVDVGQVVAGLVQPDSGTIRLDGEAVTLGSRKAAAALGIGVVHQHFSLVPPMTVAENVELGRPGGCHRTTRWRGRPAHWGERTGLTVDPDVPSGRSRSGSDSGSRSSGPRVGRSRAAARRTHGRPVAGRGRRGAGRDPRPRRDGPRRAPGDPQAARGGGGRRPGHGAARRGGRRTSRGRGACRSRRTDRRDDRHRGRVPAGPPGPRPSPGPRRAWTRFRDDPGRPAGVRGSRDGSTASTWCRSGARCWAWPAWPATASGSGRRARRHRPAGRRRRAGGGPRSPATPAAVHAAGPWRSCPRTGPPTRWPSILPVWANAIAKRHREVSGWRGMDRAAVAEMTGRIIARLGVVPAPSGHRGGGAVGRQPAAPRARSRARRRPGRHRGRRADRGLDPGSARRRDRRLPRSGADNGAGVLVVASDLDELLEVADAVVVLVDGRHASCSTLAQGLARRRADAQSGRAMVGA